MNEIQNDYEIRLIDILRVIWKWKYRIAAGTLICGLVVGIVSCYLPKTYAVEIILEPGTLYINEKGEDKYIDTIINIKNLIEVGFADFEILNMLQEKGVKNIPESLKYKVFLSPHAESIVVRYETLDVEQGQMILSELAAMLKKKYESRVAYYRSEKQLQVELNEIAIKKENSLRESYKIDIKNYEQRIKEIENEYKIINDNTKELMHSRSLLLSTEMNQDNVFSLLLYSNVVQQNLQLGDSYRDKIKTLKATKEQVERDIKASESQCDKFEEQKKRLLFQKANIQNIQMVTPPTPGPFPVRPKILLNLVLSILGGLILMLVIAFLSEYLNNEEFEVK